MSAAAKKFLLILILFVTAVTAVGWMYGHWRFGLFVAVLVALLWQVRQLIYFERALRSDDADEFRYGDGLWSQLYSKFRFEQSRAVRRKANYRQLLREVRNSTNAMPDGTVILTADNEMVACNRAAKKLTGLKRSRDRGQNIEFIIRDPKLATLLAENISDQSVEIESPVSEGRWLDCRIVPYGAEQKLLLLRDVTERHQMRKIRRDFVANASHELRSPLTVITGYLDSFATDDELPRRWQRPMQQMQSQAVRMATVLQELLELSRLEGSEGAIAAQDIDVAELLQTVVREFNTPEQSTQIDVQISAQCHLSGIRSEIESVVVNLLSNAIRHSAADGKVTLSWRGAGNKVEIAVADEGEGIAANDVPRLTERFFRVDRGRGRDGGGIGLGLAIVKHILLRHDAKLIVKSEPGEGSEFICQFPAARIVTKVQ